MKQEVDAELVIPDADRTLRDHAVAPWEPTSSNYYPQLLEAVCEHFSIDMDVPFNQLPEKHQSIILNGSGKEKIFFHYENDFGRVREHMIVFEGVLANVGRRYRETSSDYIREQMETYMSQKKLSHV